MEDFTSGLRFRGKTRDSAATDTKDAAKKTDSSSAPSKFQSAVQVPAKTLDGKSAASSTPLSRLMAWIQAPSNEELEARALAAQITRVSIPFRAFVREACPTLSEANITEAVNLIAQIAPPPDGASDEAVAAHVNEFLPLHEVWSNDGRTPAQRAQYLMEVLERCKQRVFTDQLLDTFSSGSASPPPTAREMWGKVSD